MPVSLVLGDPIQIRISLLFPLTVTVGNSIRPSGANLRTVALFSEKQCNILSDYLTLMHKQSESTVILHGSNGLRQFQA